MTTRKTKKKPARTTNDRFVEQPGLMSNVRKAPGLKNAKKSK